MGAFVFLFGIIAFNGGSQAAISNEGDGTAVAKAAVNTLISLSGATLAAVVYNFYYGQPKSAWSTRIALNGSFVGMVVP